MKDTGYILIDKDGIIKGRLYSKPPARKAGEFAIQIAVDVADHFFKRHIPIARLTIDERHVLRPDLEVQLQESDEFVRAQVLDYIEGLVEELDAHAENSPDDADSALVELEQIQHILGYTEITDSVYDDLAQGRFEVTQAQYRQVYDDYVNA